MLSKRLRFLDLKFLCLGWNYKLVTTIMSLSLDERFWSWGKYIPTQFKWKISKVWAPPSHTPSLSISLCICRNTVQKELKKARKKKKILSRMQAKQQQIITRCLFSAQNTFWFLFQQAPAHSKSVTHEGKYSLFFRNFHDFFIDCICEKCICALWSASNNFVVGYTSNNSFANSMIIYSLEMESCSRRPKLLN